MLRFKLSMTKTVQMEVEVDAEDLDSAIDMAENGMGKKTEKGPNFYTYNARLGTQEIDKDGKPVSVAW